MFANTGVNYGIARFTDVGINNSKHAEVKFPRGQDFIIAFVAFVGICCSHWGIGLILLWYKVKVEIFEAKLVIKSRIPTFM